MILPAYARLDSAYSASTNTIINSYKALQTIILTDCINLYSSKFSCSAIFSAIGSPVFNFISVIIFSCVPSKIAQMVILRVSIIMATFHSKWSFAYKRFKNKLMWSCNSNFIVFPQTNKRTIVSFTDCKFFNFIGFYRKNLTIIRNFIDSFKTDYFTPFFHNSTHMYNKGTL